MNDQPKPPEPLFGRRTSLALAMTTGFLFYVSFPGLDLWPFAFIAWVPWMLALRGASPRLAALQGWLAGMVMGVPGFYWLMEMLEVFSGFPTALCALFMLLLCAYQAGRYALLGWLYARAERRGWPAGLVFTAAFAATEQAYPLLFPFTFGATMHEVYPILQVAEVGGPILVALVVLTPGWALARWVGQWRESKLGRRDGNLVLSQRPVGGPHTWFGFGLPVLVTLYGMQRIVQVDEAVHDAEKVRVGIVQANMGLGAKRERVSEGRDRHIKMTRKLVKRDRIELAVWPETSVAGVVSEDEMESYYPRAVTGRLGTAAIVGAILAREVDDAREYVLFNSALSSDREGAIRGRYDKQYLLAFGEYLPFGEAFPQLYEWSPNSGHFTPGKTYEPLPFRDQRIATFICYEDIIPSFVNELMQHQNPGLLVNMTNDAWFGDTSEPWEHMALAKLRAVEQRRWLVRATNSGISGFVDPVGRLTKRSATFEREVLFEDVTFHDTVTPYRHLGDKPWWLLTAASVAMAFFRRPRRRTEGSRSERRTDSVEGALTNQRDTNVVPRDHSSEGESSKDAELSPPSAR